MGLFDFAGTAGTKLKNAIGLGHEETNAQELAQSLRDHGVTIEKGMIKVKGDTITITGVATTQAEREKAVLILGNTHGIAHVDDQMTVAAPARPAAAPSAAPQPAPSASTFYTVKSGDTLSKIAKQLYGDANRYPELFEANKPMLKDPDKIYPGQVLRIPKATEH
jgi:nucleoid-associated protein YgaU